MIAILILIFNRWFFIINLMHFYNILKITKNYKTKIIIIEKMGKVTVSWWLIIINFIFFKC